jgi:hypothetical protein
MSFHTSMWNPFKKTKKSYTGKVDEFLVYCPYTNEVYRVPINVCGSSNKTLRLTPPKNNQRQK